MAINYDEVITELRATEARLEEELKQLREAIPAMIILRNRARMDREIAAERSPQMTIVGIGRFAGMGATKAIPEFLKGKTEALNSREIMDGMMAEGWTSDAQKPIGAVSATLITLEKSGVVERVGEGWRLKPSPTVAVQVPPSWKPSNPNVW
jgi:hypothetical protein